MDKLINENQVISCMGIVISKKENESFVALLQDKNNCWVIPKGHLEKNENYIETAIREVKEETSIIINKNNFVSKIDEYKYYTEKEKCYKIVKVYLFKVNNMQHIVPLFKENFINGKWVPIDEAIKIVSYKEQKEILSKVKNIYL